MKVANDANGAMDPCRSFLRSAVGEIIPALALLVLVAVAYWPALFLGWFPLDDAQFIAGNPALTKPSGWYTIWFIPEQNPHYYPLLLSVFRILLQIFGLDPVSFHAANLISHAAAVLLLWKLLQFLDLRMAWFAAAAWAVHPLNVQTVAWITEMKNTLSTAFFFAALLALARGWNAKNLFGWWSAAFVLFAAAMLTKSTSVSFLLAAVLLAWAARWPWSRRHLLGLAPFLLFGVVFALFSWGIEKSFSAQTPGQSFSFAELFIASGKGLFFYFSKVFWPFDLTFIYPLHDLEASEWRNYAPSLLWMIGLAVLFLFARATAQRWPAASMSYFTVVVGALPFVGIAFVRVFSHVTDHFVYLPIVAPIALAVCGTGALLGATRARAGIVCASICVFACTFLTHRQSAIFGTAEFWRRAVAAVPATGPHHGWYAFRLIEEGRIEEGRAVALAALADKPDLQSALLAAGMAGARSGAPRAALPYLRKLAEFSGGTMPHPIRLSLYANGLMLAGEHKQAEQILTDLRARSLLPLLGYLDLARCFLEMGYRDQALRAYEDALRIDPRGARANEQLAVALAEQGDLAMALDRARRAVASDPSSVSARVNLAKMLSSSGDHASALAIADKLLREQPSEVRLRIEKANLLQAAGLEEEAVAALDAAVRADASNIDAANNLAWILVNSSNSSLRDPQRAVDLARSAVANARQGRRDDVLHLCLGTLSRALKSAGRTDEAKSAAAEASQLAREVGDENFREGLQRDGLIPPD